MFLLISVLLILSAAAVIYFFQTRQRPILTEKKRSYLAEETDLRPLFAPEKRDLDRSIREENAGAAKLRNEAAAAERDSELELARRSWVASPGRKTTGQLIRLATDTKNADTFAETANEILRAHREGLINGLTDNDLAALLDSHYVLLPVNERGSGALFLIKQEIAKLRSSAQKEVG